MGVVELPVPVCRDYNTPVYCSAQEQCPRLHICKYFVYGRCRKGADCKRYHEIPSNFKSSVVSTSDLKKALAEAKLPDGVPTPRQTIVPRPLRRLGRTKVYFDLEKTGHGSDAHIIQIAAVVGIQNFNKYVKPKKPIEQAATNEHHLRMNNHGQLFCEITGQVVQTHSIFTAINHFLYFLSKHSAPILIGHECKEKDAKILISALKATKTFDRFRDIVPGFLDSFTLTKEVLPHLKRHTLGNLFYYFRHDNYRTHNALQDARACAQVVNSVDAPFVVVQRHTFDCIYINWVNRAVYFKKIAEESLKPLLRAGIVSQEKINKIAESGLDMNSLIRAAENEKVEELFGYNIDGKPRVPMEASLIEKVEIFLKAYKREP